MLVADDDALLRVAPGAQDSVPHAAKGMVSAFTVTAGTAQAAAVAPASSGTITIVREGYQVPAGLTSGTYRVQNDFDQPAEAALSEAPSRRHGQGRARLRGRPGASGTPALQHGRRRHDLAPRASAVAQLELSKGAYALLSFAPNMAAGGAPQFLSGLLTEVTVP